MTYVRSLRFFKILTITITIIINLEQGKHVGGRNESNRSRNGVYDICKVKATVLS